MEPEITVNSEWIHHSGRRYFVLNIANTAHTSEKYPVTIVYAGENGNIWAKTKDRFLATMRPA